MRIVKNPHRSIGLTDPSLTGVPHPSISARKPIEMLKRCPRAEKTPLLQSPDLAARLGVSQLWLKDERNRMGLGSFKALGAAYVIARNTAEEANSKATYITASAGNHGMSVAAGAAAFGQEAVVYISEQVPQSFANRIEATGADVVREGATYEDSMEAAAQAAQKLGAMLLSDSSWDGYMDAPFGVMEGYLVLMDEVCNNLTPPPTHIFLQAGVGGLAASAAALARDRWRDAPKIIVVEPEAAPALIKSIEAGRPLDTTGPDSAMGRLDCKTPSLIALKGLARDADFFVEITEEEGQAGADLTVQAGIASSPSGAAGIAGLAAGQPHFGALGIGQDARVLAILSEGPEV
ncbi:MAG: pyridoxal-phosphate dependent enzyme [Paracoccaceae bacterium]